MALGLKGYIQPGSSDEAEPMAALLDEDDQQAMKRVEDKIVDRVRTEMFAPLERKVDEQGTALSTLLEQMQVNQKTLLSEMARGPPLFPS